jgi:DNA-binding YbaB/EbfC family protein
MFDMFKNMGAMAGLLSNLPKIQERMKEMQSRLAQIVVEGDAGAGMVKAKANGRMELVGLTISDEAMKLNDREMLEDLVKGAVNHALTKAREAMAEETGKLGESLGLPPGIKIPGMG